MSDLRTGDVVALPKRPGRWIARENDDNAPAPFSRWRFVRAAAGSAIEGAYVDPASAEVLERPAFSPGLRVAVNGRRGAVIAEAGDAVHVLLDPTSRPLSGGRARLHVPAAEAFVPRWQLALELENTRV